MGVGGGEGFSSLDSLLLIPSRQKAFSRKPILSTQNMSSCHGRTFNLGSVLSIWAHLGQSEKTVHILFVWLPFLVITIPLTTSLCLTLLRLTRLYSSQ